MEKWPLRLYCAFSLLLFAQRQIFHAFLFSISDWYLFLLWAVGGLISLVVAAIVLLEGVR